MAFLSLKCDEIKSELENETSDLIGRDEFTQQQKHAQMDSAGKPVTTRRKGKEDDTDDIKQHHTFTNPNLESDQQTRYQDIYNQLKSLLAKQDTLEQQLNMKLNNLREDTEGLKADVGSCNQSVETGKCLLRDYSQKMESLENTVSCLSGNVNKMYSDQQKLVDRINSHLSAIDEQDIADLPELVDEINTDLTVRIDQVNKDLSAKVSQIKTDLSAKVGQINAVLLSLLNSQEEHAVKINKITHLEKHFNTIERDVQNNGAQVQQPLDEMRGHLTDPYATVPATCAKKSDHGAVGFNAATTFAPRLKVSPSVGMFEPPTFIAGCQFKTDRGTFTASSGGIYLASVRMYLYKDSYSCVSLIREYTEFDGYEGAHAKEAQICCVQAERKGSTACSLDIVTMEAGDKLFIRTFVDLTFNSRIQFLCVRIG